MEGIQRKLDLALALSKKSHLLLGPRQTGKSYLIRTTLKADRVYDLLLKETFKKLSFNPSMIREELKPSDRLIVVDEIQKLPDLLDEIQWMIENHSVYFLLTGSSARKLKKHGANLLGGRARLLKMHPFIRVELKKHFDLDRALNRGLLPSIYFSDDPDADLESYVSLYLQQEIANESLTRNLPAFSRVLEVAALCQAEHVDITAISNDAQVSRTTVHEYFQILEDTLLIHKVPAFARAKKRKLASTEKFYFFDWGVAKHLQGIGKISKKNPLFGKAFESYLFHELKSASDYLRLPELKFWRTQDGAEVDFVYADQIGIEVKGKETVTDTDLNRLKKLAQEKVLKRHILLYTGPTLKPRDSIEIMNYQDFLEEIWES